MSKNMMTFIQGFKDLFYGLVVICAAIVEIISLGFIQPNWDFKILEFYLDHPLKQKKVTNGKSI
jgi:hypothetical protein